MASISSPLRPLANNPHFFDDGTGKAVLLAGSHTWNDFQDTDQSSTPKAADFDAYVAFLKSHGHNATILWRKDLPTYCNWGAGGTWQVAPFPWPRTGASMASDGLPAFDLSTFYQPYFDRLRARVTKLGASGIYAIVELFDGLGLTNNRCAQDGYPFSAGNNVNGIDDGGGTHSMTMSAPTPITAIQDAFVKKVIDTLSDQPNVLWEISEEAPDDSTWWQGHMIALIHSYESGKPVAHPVLFPTLNVSAATDSTLYNSDADAVAPMARISPTSSCGTGQPSCKVNLNDSDHSYFGIWNDSDQVQRNYVWENFANGNSVLFMDPYLVYWSGGSRNLCPNPVAGICSSVASRWDNLRDNLGYVVRYASKMSLAAMSPHPELSSTGYCLANAASSPEYLVYAPVAGNLRVDLSAASGTVAVEWFNPATGAVTPGAQVAGGGSVDFSPPFQGDSVLYLRAP
jgi:hypothetical protein